MKAKVSSGLNDRSSWLACTVVGRPGSVSRLHSYDLPALSSSAQTNAAASGGVLISATGSGYGLYDVSPMIGVGDTYGRSNVWLSETSLRGRLSPGVGAELPMRVAAGCCSTGTSTQVFSFDKPTVSSIQPSYAATTGQALLYLAGRNFGTFDSTVSISVGDTQCTESTYVSNLVLSCLVSPGVGASQIVRATIGGQVAASPVLFSYMGPTLVGIARQNGPATGGVQVTLQGKNFGSSESSPKGRAGTAAEGTIWTSDTQVILQPSSALFPKATFSMTVARSVNTDARIFSIDVPYLTDISPSNSPVLYRPSLDIAGQNFGTSDYSLSVYFSKTAASFSSWVSDSTLSSSPSIGFGQNMSINVVRNNEFFPSSFLFSFDSPFLSNRTSQGNYPTSGVGKTTLLGINFCAFDMSLKVRILSTQVKTSVWTSDSSISCSSIPPGVSFGTMTTETIYDKFPSSGFIQYDHPFASLASTCNLAIHAAIPFKFGILGNALSVFDPSLQARISQTTSPNSIWISDTSLTCQSTMSLSCSLKSILTVGILQGTTTGLLSYDTIRLSSILRVNVFTQTFLNITAMNLLIQKVSTQSVSLRVGYSSCESSQWENVFGITCKVTYARIQNSQALLLTTSKLVSSYTQTLSFDGLAVSSLAQSNVFQQTQAAVGTFFNSIGFHSPASRLGSTSASGTLWNSQFSLSLRVSPSISGSLSVRITNNNVVETISKVISFDIINLEYIKNRDTPDGTDVFVSGLMSSASEFTLSARTGGSSCETTQWISQTNIMCSAAAGSKGMHGVILTSSLEVSTMTEVYTFGPPSMFCLVNQTLTSNNTMVIIDGRRFGEKDFSPRVRMGGSGCSNTKWMSDRQLVCKGADGMGSQLRMVVTVLALESTNTNCVSYMTATVQQLLLPNGPVKATILTMLGDHLALFSLTPASRVGYSSCELTGWISASALICHASTSSARGLAAVVTAQTLRSSFTAAFTYDFEGFESSYSNSSRNSATGGGSKQALLSINRISASDMTSSVRLGHSAIQSSEWQSTSTLYVKSSRGIGHDLKLAVTVSNRYASCSDFYSYDTSNLKNSSALELSVENASHLQLRGEGFGFFGISPRMIIGFSLTEHVLWTSDSSVSALVLPGVGGGFVANYNDLFVSGDIQFSYTPPIALNWTATFFPSLTMQGLNLGRWSDYTLQSRLSSTSSEQTTWLSTSSLFMKLPSAQGGSLRVAISVGQQLGSSSFSVTFDAQWLSSTQNSAGQAEQFIMSGLGVYSNSMASRIGSSMSLSTRWVSESNLYIKSVSNSQSSVSMIVTSSVLVHTSTSLFSFDLPTVLVSVTNIPSMPPFVSSATSNTTYLAYSSSVRFGQTAAQMTVWLSYTSILSKATAGYKGTLNHCLTANSRPSSNSLALSYDSADLTKLLQSNLSTNLCSKPSVLVIPTTLPAQKGTISSRFGFTSTEYTAWIGESAIYTKAASGHARSLSLVLTLFHVSTLTSVLSFDRPTVMEVTGLDGNLFDGAHLLVYGTNFGLYDASINAVVETRSDSSNKVDSSTWTSDTSVHVYLLPVYGEPFIYFQSYGYRTPSFSIDFPFVPNVLSAVPNVHDTQGDFNFTSLFGTKFGIKDYTARVSLGDTITRNTIWTSYSSLLCQVSAGVGQFHQYFVTIFGNIGVGSSFYSSYGRPLPVEFVGVDEVDVFLVNGRFFGYGSDYSIRASVSSSSCPSSSWISDSSLMLKTSTGQGVDLDLVVTVDQQTGSASSKFSFQPPRISSLTREDLTCFNRSIYTVYGSYFATFDGSLSLRVGGSQQQSSVWVSETSISAKPIGLSRASLGVIVSINRNIGSVSQMYSSCLPQLSAIYPVNIGSSTSVSLSVFGILYGRHSSSATASIGFSVAAGTTWTSETSISCLSAKSQRGMQHMLRLTMNVLPSTMTNVLSWDGPFISSIHPNNSPTSGAIIFTMFGSSFGTMDVSMSIRIGNNICSSSRWKSDTQMICQVPQGVQVGQSVHLQTANATIATVSMLFSYDKPLIFPGSLQIVGNLYRSNSVTGNPAAKGRDLVEFLGANLGRSDLNEVLIFYGPRQNKSQYQCTVDDKGSFVNETRVRCYTDPQGYSRNLSFLLKVGLYAVDGTDFYSYPPIIHQGTLRIEGRLSNLALDSTQGGQMFSFEGANFGNIWDQMTIRYFGSYAPFAKFETSILYANSTSDKLVGILGPGVGFAIVFLVEIQNVSVAGQDTFSFPAPVIENGSLWTAACGNGGNNCMFTSTIDSEKLYLRGQNFGNFPSLISIFYGRDGSLDSWSRRYPCFLNSSNDTFISCLASPGTGKDLYVEVNIAGQIVRSHDTVSYPPPYIVDVSPLNSGTVPFNYVLRDGFGSDVLIINGGNFGPDMTVVSVMFGRIGLDTWTQARLLRETSNSSLVAFSPGIGSGAWLTTRIEVGGQSAYSKTYFSYPFIGKIAGWEVDSSQSTIVGMQSSMIYSAGTTQRFYIKTVSYSGNLLTLGGADFQLSLSGPAYITSNSIDGQDGIYFIDFFATRSGQYLAKVFQMPWNQDVKNSPFMITVSSEMIPNATMTTVLFENAVLRCGRNESLLLIFRDRYGNTLEVQRQPYHTQVSFVSNVAVHQGSSDVLNLNLYGTRSGPFYVEISVNATRILQNPIRNTLQPSSAIASNSEVAFMQNTIIAGSFVQVAIITVRDLFGNIASQGGDSIKVKLPIAEESYDYLVYDQFNGTYHIDALVKIQGNFSMELYVNDQPTVSSTSILHVLPSSPDASFSQCRGIGLTIATAGMISSFYIMPKDMYANVISDFRYLHEFQIFSQNLETKITYSPSDFYLANASFQVEMFLTLSGQYTLSVIRSGQVFCHPPVFLRVLPQDYDINAFIISKSIVGGILTSAPLQFEVYPRDKYGNTANVRGFLNISVQPLVNVTQTVTSLSIRVIWIPKVAGVYVFNIRTSSGELLFKGPISANVVTQAGPASAQQSQIVNVASNRQAGKPMDATIVTAADNGVQLNTGGLSFTALILNSLNLQTVTSLPVLDFANGTYAVAFSVTASGSYSLSVRLGSQDIGGSPASFAVLPGPTFPANTVVYLQDGQAVTAGLAFSFQVQTRDEYGNARGEGGDEVAI
eukprot:762567-Hanusia_phi.AAC.1